MTFKNVAVSKHFRKEKSVWISKIRRFVHLQPFAAQRTKRRTIDQSRTFTFLDIAHLAAMTKATRKKRFRINRINKQS